MNSSSDFSTEINTFFNNNKYLCIGTLFAGLLIYAVGNLAGRVVRMVCESLNTTKKTNEQAEKILLESKSESTQRALSSHVNPKPESKVPTTFSQTITEINKKGELAADAVRQKQALQAQEEKANQQRQFLSAKQKLTTIHAQALSEIDGLNKSSAEIKKSWGTENDATAIGNDIQGLQSQIDDLETNNQADKDKLRSLKQAKKMKTDQKQKIENHLRNHQAQIKKVIQGFYLKVLELPELKHVDKTMKTEIVQPYLEFSPDLKEYATLRGWV